LRIHHFKRQIGPGQDAYRIGFLGNAETEEQALEMIEEYLMPLHMKGFNEEHGYWWGRNVGDLETTILIPEYEGV
jgi:hypothetical protein